MNRNAANTTNIVAGPCVYNMTAAATIIQHDTKTRYTSVEPKHLLQNQAADETQPEVNMFNCHYAALYTSENPKLSFLYSWTCITLRKMNDREVRLSGFISLITSSFYVP
jgi:hypothetical protein